jgi:hypothetical protein
VVGKDTKEIEHKKKLDEAQSKKGKDKRQDSSKPESSNHKGDKRSLMIKDKRRHGFLDTSKSKDKDEPNCRRTITTKML